MAFEESLHALGVRSATLSAQEKRFLDEQGFLLLHDVITPAEAQRMRQKMEERLELEQIADPAECVNLQNKSEVFDVCVTHPRVLAAVAHVVREEFKSNGVNAFPNLPGRKQQALHVDGDYAQNGEYLTCNSMWPLTDFTEENGATRVVPGSHRSGRRIDDDLRDPKDDHPQQIRLIAKVGTVVIFNGHLWHGATLNRSDHRRASVTSFWRRRRLPASWRKFYNPLTPAAAARLGAAAQNLFDPPL